MIYAVQPTTGGPVKIGYSDDVPARIRQLECHYGQTLTLLATLPGGLKEERAIHERFDHLRLGRTEQFRPAADLMAFLGCPLLVGANPDAVEAIGPVLSDIQLRTLDRDDVTVKIPRRIALMGKAIARDRGISLAEFLEELLTVAIDKGYAAMLRRQHPDFAALTRDPS